MFPPAGFRVGPGAHRAGLVAMHEELKRRGVTLVMLWEEYRAEHADGYGYSRFCELYSDWRKRISPTMRQTHVAGEKLFVDWAGDTMPVFDPMTGEEHARTSFVAALGASNYTYAEARWTETLPDWIGAHVNALGCDRRRAEGGGARQSQGWASPSRRATSPASTGRIRISPTTTASSCCRRACEKPRDKAKVEVAVGSSQRFVLASCAIGASSRWPS